MSLSCVISVQKIDLSLKKTRVCSVNMELESEEMNSLLQLEADLDHAIEKRRLHLLTAADRANPAETNGQLIIEIKFKPESGSGDHEFTMSAHYQTPDGQRHDCTHPPPFSIAILPMAKGQTTEFNWEQAHELSFMDPVAMIPAKRDGVELFPVLKVGVWQPGCLALSDELADALGLPAAPQERCTVVKAIEAGVLDTLTFPGPGRFLPEAQLAARISRLLHEDGATWSHDQDGLYTRPRAALKPLFGDVVHLGGLHEAMFTLDRKTSPHVSEAFTEFEVPVLSGSGSVTVTAPHLVPPSAMARDQWAAQDVERLADIDTRLQTVLEEYRRRRAVRDECTQFMKDPVGGLRAMVEDNVNDGVLWRGEDALVGDGLISSAFWKHAGLAKAVDDVMVKGGNNPNIHYEATG